jgi:hypothetical protein
VHRNIHAVELKINMLGPDEFGIPIVVKFFHGNV